WRYKGLIFGAPAYYGRIYPKMANLLYKVEEIGIKNHKVGFFTDFSWSNGADRYFNSFIEKTKADVVGKMVNIQGYANIDDENKLQILAKEIAESIK
ncbi:MAG: FprA family A-type flavoprotein, partial [Eubacterium sp.]